MSVSAYSSPGAIGKAHTDMITFLNVSCLFTVHNKHILLRMDPYASRKPEFISALANLTETEITVVDVHETPLLISITMVLVEEAQHNDGLVDNDATTTTITTTKKNKIVWRVIGLVSEMRVSTHIIVRLQRRWRRIQEWRKQRLIAFCMGTHRRLGSSSLVYCISDNDVVKRLLLICVNQQTQSIVLQKPAM